MIKKCELCGVKFNGRKNSRFCNDPHYKNCENCGGKFLIKENDRPAKTCSKKCSDVLTVKNSKKIVKICEWKNCKKEFKAIRNNIKFCNEEHFDTCLHCGKTFKIVNIHKPATTCSKICASTLVDFNDRNKKAVETNLKKYGVENPSQSEQIKAKKQETTLENYGVINPFYSEEIQKKVKATNLKKYGTEYSLASPIIRKQIKETNLKKYGTEFASQSEKVKNKIKATNLGLYGVENVFMLTENQLKAAASNGNRISKTNLKWQKKLKELFNVDFNLEVPFGDNFADLGYGKLLIDINPSFTHSSTASFVHLTKKCTDKNCKKLSHKPRDKKYHQLRAIEAEENGFILLQYFDWMDEEKFFNIIRTKLKLNEKRIYARKTIIKEISQVEANRFFKENHLFGGSNMQTFCVGLFYEGELVHCQTYGKARFNKNFEWEAIRSATKANTYIPGAFSKCDNYFFKKVNPNSVISYIDLSFSNGRTELSFDNWRTLKINKPTSTWVNLYDNNYPVFIKDSAARRVSADRLLGFEVGEKYPRFDKDGNKITNSDVLSREGFIEVFDAGTKTIVWSKD